MPSLSDWHAGYFRAWRRRIMIVALAATAYGPVLRMGFLWDDHVMIEHNPMLASWSASALRHDFTHDVFDGHGDPYYRPLQTIANRVDYTVWKLQPFGYHLTNLLLHTGNSLLIGELIIVLGGLPAEAMLAGCLFAVHPIGVEQLMIIAGRAELLGLFFGLLTILFLLEESMVSFASAAAVFILALFSKESAVVTPFLAALAFYLRREPLRRYARPLFLLLLIPPYLALRRYAVGPVDLHIPAAWYPLFYAKAFGRILWRYAGLIVFPWDLHSHRMMPHLSHTWFLYVAAWLVLAAVLRRFRFGLFCLGWFALSLLPKTAAMMGGGFMLDHWAYPAVFPAAWALAWAVCRAWESRRFWIRAMAGFVFLLLLIGYSLLVRFNIDVRETDEKMYRWALNFTTSHPIKYNLAVLLLDTGRPVEASVLFEDVLDAYPEDQSARRGLEEARRQLRHHPTPR